MTDIAVLPQQIQSHLLRELQNQDIQAKIFVKQTSLGWLKIQVVTNRFEGQSIAEREGIIDDLLATIGLNLGQHPISHYSLMTPEEATNQPRETIQLPL